MTSYQSLPDAPARSEKTNVLAIVALVLSFFIGLGGVICGFIALSQIRATGEKGRGLAIAGIIIGFANIIVGIISAIALTTLGASMDAYGTY